MAGVLHLWNEWEVQILDLVSFVLQVLLLIFARMRRRNISRMLRILIWLMYLLADSTAIYTLGHMSINCKPDEHHQLMAFWAPFLLVHLGGQDTITAYAMEDNQLWLRHMLTYVAQALGAAYVLYKNIGRQGPLVMAAVMMFLVGVLKNGERVWALSSSSLESISKLLDNANISQQWGYYSTHGQEFDDEVVLQGAHDLMYICMGQFVDDKIWPSVFQMDAIKLFYEMDSTYELIEMQLSLMYDMFYTKAAVIHTWYGCSIRAVLFLSTVTAFVLFQFGTFKDGYNRVDVIVTYILLTGASLLEIASVLRAMMSTWTCAMLRSRGWDRLHRLLVSLRWCVREAQTKRWSGSMGQHNLVDSTENTSPCNAMISLWKNGSSSVISMETKKLVLNEISRMVQACEGKENVLRSYSGQSALKRHDGLLEDLAWSLEMEFDERILAWHLATNELLKDSNLRDVEPLVEATKALSNYMMFLFVERPYMLPSPVRPRLYVKAREEMKAWPRMMQDFSTRDRRNPSVLDPGVTLAKELLSKKPTMLDLFLLNYVVSDLLQVVFGVWVEMLCYAAHHCSRDSHARQLNNGGEFITIAWLLTTAEFNRVYCREEWFKSRSRYRLSWDLLLVPCQRLSSAACWCLLWSCRCLLWPCRCFLKMVFHAFWCHPRAFSGYASAFRSRATKWQCHAATGSSAEILFVKGVCQGRRCRVLIS